MPYDFCWAQCVVKNKTHLQWSPKDWAVHQSEAMKKFYLVYKNFEMLGKKEILEKYKNNHNFVKYGKFPRNVLSIFLYRNVSIFLY